ncbi:MAG: hypothetical protein ABI912_00785 [Actinomycetota bacterium]
MFIREYVLAEVANRTQQLTDDYRAANRPRKRRLPLRLPSRPGGHRVRARALASD